MKSYGAIIDPKDLTTKQYVDDMISTNSKKSKLFDKTITTSWTGNSPYKQNISVEGVTTNNIVEIGIPQSATAEQIKQYQSLGLIDGGQSSGNITLSCSNKKNTINIPIYVIVRGDL